MSEQLTGSVVIACGGTGGHLFPGVAVAQELKSRGHRVTLLISRKNVDARASEQYGDLEFKVVEAIGMPKIPSLGLVRFAFKLLRSRCTAKKILREVEADAVIGMGGFTSFPAVLAARELKLHTYVHDSNALPGKANRMIARWSDRVLLGVQEAAHYFDAGKCIVTGTPVREEMVEALPRAEGLAWFNLPDSGERTVLAMGGSQGAKNLNTLVVQAAGQCEGLCRFILMTGAADYERVRDMTVAMPHVHVVDFCSNMAAAYAAADVVICRSGASSLTELAHLGKASFLVPYPYAADDHQAHNARVFAQDGAARVCREESLNAEVLAAFLHEVFDAPVALETMEEAAFAEDVPDAASRIADVIQSDLFPPHP